MTKNANAKAWILHEWLDGTKRSYPEPSATALMTAIDSLSTGEWVDFTANTIQHVGDIQWQLATIFYDRFRRELQYMGKPASGQDTSLEFRHYLYQESSDTWLRTISSAFDAESNNGHVWQYAFDPYEGNYYFRMHANDLLRVYTRANGTDSDAWSDTPTCSSQTGTALSEGSGAAHPMCWHPNLFGVGIGGVVIWGVFRFFAYRPSDQTWHILTGTLPGTGGWQGRQNGQGLYLPGPDRVVFFASESSGSPQGDPAAWVDAGAGNETDAIGAGLIQLTSEPPIVVSGSGGTTAHGHAIQHPDDPDVLLILEEQGDETVWESADFGATWTEWTTKGTHPFRVDTGDEDEMTAQSDGEFTVGVIPARDGHYGAIIAMTSDVGGGNTRLWKPPAPG